MGRPRGSLNRRTLLVDEIAAKFDKDPFEILMMVAVGDWKGLGYEAKSKTTFTMNGIEVEEENIKLSDRVSAAKEAARYLYAHKQSIAVSTDPESGFVIKVVDYTKKELK